MACFLAWRIFYRSQKVEIIALIIISKIKKRRKCLCRKTITSTCASCWIDEFGLDTTDRALLSLIIDKYDGGPVGVETIAAALSEDVRTIEDVCEPYLLQAGFLQRTPRGRKVSPEGYRHLGIKQPSEQKSLFEF